MWLKYSSRNNVLAAIEKMRLVIMRKSGQLQVIVAFVPTYNSRWAILKSASVIVAILLLAGCASIEFPTVCRHDALKCALSAGEKYGYGNVRIAGGLDKKNRYHAQAYVIVNGEKYWLDKDCWETEQEVWQGKDFSIREFIKSQWPRLD